MPRYKLTVQLKDETRIPEFTGYLTYSLLCRTYPTINRTHGQRSAIPLCTVPLSFEYRQVLNEGLQLVKGTGCAYFCTEQPIEPAQGIGEMGSSLATISHCEVVPPVFPEKVFWKTSTGIALRKKEDGRYVSELELVTLLDKLNSHYLFCPNGSRYTQIVHGGLIVGWGGLLRVSGSKEDHEHLWNFGIGSRRHYGFGMLTPFFE